MRVHSAPSLGAAAVMLLASSIPSRAQDSLQRRGWLLLGFGSGLADIACHGDGCTSGGAVLRIRRRPTPAQSCCTSTRASALAPSLRWALASLGLRCACTAA